MKIQFWTPHLVYRTHLLIILLWLSIFGNVKISRAQDYDPQFFPIGVWSVKGDFRTVDDFLFDVNTAGTYHHTSFQNLHNGGFNAVFLSYDPIGYTLDTILDIAELYDVKVIASMQHLHEVIEQSGSQAVTDAEITQAILNDSIERLKRSPVVLGYFLYDEPIPSWIDMNTLQRAKNLLAQITSDAPHPILSTWHDEALMDELDSYLQPDVVMMVSYPFEDGDSIGDVSDYMPSYFSSMPDPPPYSDYINTVRERHCDSINRPMWVVLQAFGDVETPENGGYWRQVYPKELRLEVYLAVMQGAKGIWYFLYESEYPYLLGLLDESGQPTVRLIEVEDINEELNVLAGTLLKLRVFQDQSAVQSNRGEVKMHYDSTDTSHPKYVIAVNTDVNASQAIQITVNKNAIGYPVQGVENVYDHQAINYTETTDSISFTTVVEAGGGAVIRLSDTPLDIALQKNTQIRVYPNPTSDFLYIQHDFTSLISYEIKDMQGKLIMTDRFLNNNSPIDLRKMSPGVYRIAVKTEKGIFVQKFIKW